MEKHPIDQKNANINLYSIAVTFLELYRSYRSEKYFLAMASVLYLKEKLYDVQVVRTQPDMSEEELKKFREVKLSDMEANRYLRQGIRIAEENREIDLRENFPSMEGLEFKKILAMAAEYSGGSFQSDP